MRSDPNAELAGLFDTDVDSGLDITQVIRAAFEAITAPLLNATDSTWDGNSSF